MGGEGVGQEHFRGSIDAVHLRALERGGGGGEGSHVANEFKKCQRPLLFEWPCPM